MEVYLSALAETKLLHLTNYILENWGKLIRDNYIKEFTNKVSQISNQPNSCPESLEFKGLYKCVVSKQSTFYYRINFKLSEIEIITIFDTRQDPNILENEIQNS